MLNVFLLVFMLLLDFVFDRIVCFSCVIGIVLTALSLSFDHLELSSVLKAINLSFERVWERVVFETGSNRLLAG